MQLMRALASYYSRNSLHPLGPRPHAGNPLVATRLTAAGNSPFGHRSSASAASSGNHRTSVMHDGRHEKTREGEETAKTPPLSSQPTTKSSITFPSWARWALGSILTLVLPFWSTQWQRLLRIEGEVEMAVEVVETAAEVVEQVAAVTEKVSSEVAEKLAEGGKLKSAALVVERVSEEAVQGAQTVEDIIHKVADLKQEIETLIKPAMGKDSNVKQAN